MLIIRLHMLVQSAKSIKYTFLKDLFSFLMIKLNHPACGNPTAQSETNDPASRGACHHIEPTGGEFPIILFNAIENFSRDEAPGPAPINGKDLKSHKIYKLVLD